MMNRRQFAATAVAFAPSALFGSNEVRLRWEADRVGSLARIGVLTPDDDFRTGIRNADDGSSGCVHSRISRSLERRPALRKTKLWASAGREELQRLTLRRQELLEILDRLDPSLAELDQAVMKEAQNYPAALCLMEQPGVGPVTALMLVLTIGPVERESRIRVMVRERLSKMIGQTAQSGDYKDIVVREGNASQGSCGR
jgi:hypothetical protein